jgi:glycosyltransferase involved in cell wall biosynthesis
MVCCKENARIREPCRVRNTIVAHKSVERFPPAMKLLVKLSVIVPSYKRPVDLQRCLSALSRQTRPPDEIVVVAREEDTQTLLLISSSDLKLNNLRILNIKQPGLVAALNLAIDDVKADLLVFTDDDAEAQQDWLERIEKSFTDSQIGAVGGRDWLQLPLEPSRYSPAEVTRVGTLSWYGKAHGNHHCPVRGHTKEVMFLKGVNMAIRREALGLGRIDTRLRGSGSQVGTELDVCMQIRKSGFLIVFDDRILVRHHCAPRPRGDDRCDMTGTVFEDICFNTHFLITKHFGLARAAAYFANNLLFGWRTQPGLTAAVKWWIQGDGSAFKRFLRMARIAGSGFSAGRKVRVAATGSTGGLHPFRQQDGSAV